MPRRVKYETDDLLENQFFDWFRRFDYEGEVTAKKRPMQKCIGLFTSIVRRVYSVPTAFNSLNACSKRVTIPTCPARCQARGS